MCSEARESAEGNALAGWKKRSPSKCGKLAKLGKKLGEGEEGNTPGPAIPTRRPRPWVAGGQNRLKVATPGNFCADRRK